jgi:serine/threonine protein kinase
MTSPQLSKRENFNLLDFLGKGTFGIVSKIETKDDKKVYALKQIFFPGKSQSAESKECYEEAKREYTILKKGLQNVVRSFGSFYDPKTNCFSISMTLYQYNLDRFLEAYFEKNQSNIPFATFLPIFRDIITGKIKKISTK